MGQTWRSLAFLHWPVPLATLRGIRLGGEPHVLFSPRQDVVIWPPAPVVR